jgi:hypothetical protein
MHLRYHSDISKEVIYFEAITLYDKILHGNPNTTIGEK